MRTRPATSLQYLRIPIYPERSFNDWLSVQDESAFDNIRITVESPIETNFEDPSILETVQDLDTLKLGLCEYFWHQFYQMIDCLVCLRPPNPSGGGCRGELPS